MTEVFYHFSFGPHGSATDAERLQEPYENSDLYVPEIASISPKFRRRLYAFADGKVNFEDFMRRNITLEAQMPSSFNYAQYRMIADSPKPMLILERPYHQGENRLRDFFLLKRKAVEALLADDRASAISAYSDYLLTMSEWFRRREEYLVNNFAKRIKQRIWAISELKNKEQVRVLLALGSNHIPVFDEVKRRYPEHTTADFEDQWIPTALEQVLRKLINHEEEITEDIVSQLLQGTLKQAPS